MAAPCGADQQQGHGKENEHEEPATAKYGTGRDQGRNRQMQRAGHEHLVHTEQSKAQLQEKHGRKESPDARAIPTMPLGSQHQAANPLGVQGQAENLEPSPTGEKAVSQQDRKRHLAAGHGQPERGKDKYGSSRPRLILILVKERLHSAPEHGHQGQAIENNDTRHDNSQTLPWKIERLANGDEIHRRVSPDISAP